MSAVIQFRPIVGAGEETGMCYLLQINDYCILLDCGWDESFDPSLLSTLKEIAPKIDAVLITYADIPHIGSLPYAFGKLGLNAPVYGTIPVHKMGQMTLYDTVLSRQSFSNFDLFTLDDVDLAFDNFHQLKYSQRFCLPGSNIEVVPHCAGHLIGGTVWRIVHETDEIVYAVDFNHSQERHLSSIVPSELPQSPSLLITDARNATVSSSLTRKERDNKFVEKVLDTLRRGGNVLIPCDTSGRVLELLLVLEQQWATQHLSCYGVGLLTKTAFHTCKFASSQLEWMNDSVIKTFDLGRENIFSLKYIKLCDTLEDVASLPSPKVILASTPTLTAGFSRYLFSQWCSNPLNLVLLTDNTSYKNTLAQKLLARSSTAINYHIPFVLEIREKLDGLELQEYRRKRLIELQAERDRLEEQRRKEEEERMAEGEEEQQDPFDEKANPYFTTSYDLFVKDIKQGDPFPMFPYGQAPVEWDEYGEVLPEGYLETNAEIEMKKTSRSWGLEEGMSRRAEKLKEQEEKDRSKQPELQPIECIVEGEEPTKCLVQNKTLEIKCSVDYVNFEGRSDGRSKKNILSQIAPRKLILVHASPVDMNHMTDFASEQLKCQGIFCPQPGETINLKAETAIHRLLIQDNLWSRLKFIRVPPYEVAFLHAAVKPPEQKRRKSEKNKGEAGGILRRKEGDGLPSLVVLDDGAESKEEKGEEWEPDPVTIHNARKRKSHHNPILIGDVRLPELRKAVAESGMDPHLASGMLTCSGIRVHKPIEEIPPPSSSSLPPGTPAGGASGGQKRWVVEGYVCDQYYVVRDLLLRRYQAV